MKNQVIRIIFDDPITKELVDQYFTELEKELGNLAALELYEEEFTDEDNKNGEKQWQGIE